jgi:pimeloyl-ACP methyl ester carboxylesterase
VLGYLDLAGLRVILMDQRGHGRSDQTGSGFSVDRYSRDITTVADDVGAGRFITVAYSMSSKWAQWLACTSPHRLLGQVLVAPVPAADIPVPEQEVERWLAVARSGDRDVFADWARAWTKDPLPADILDSYFSDVTRTSQVTLKATADMLTRGGTFLDRLQTTTAPTLIIGGSEDPICPVAGVRDDILARIPGARLALLDCGHEIPYERPRVLAWLLEAFVAGARP